MIGADGLFAPLGFRRRPGPVSVFAVEDDAVQVVWRSLGAGAHDLAAVTPDRTVGVEVTGDGGPGAARIRGLPADSPVQLTVDGEPVEEVATLPSPPGPELCRFATVSDLHIGGTRFGRFPAITLPREIHGDCLVAAVGELEAWGASLLVVKGDITEHGAPDEWREAAALLATATVAVESIPGNHDVGRGGAGTGTGTGVEIGVEAFAAAGLPITLGGVGHLDLPGIRIVLVDTTVPGAHLGTVAPHTEAVCDVLTGAGPAVVLLHHHLQRWQTPVHWPPGVPGPEADAFLDAVAEVNPDVVVSSGHSHRHRARRHGPLLVTEVGAPKDFPGTWAGYVVHEGGLRQVVHRVAAPVAIRTSETTARTFGGAWARWSPGPLGARCFTTSWRHGRRPPP